MKKAFYNLVFRFPRNRKELSTNDDKQAFLNTFFSFKEKDNNANRDNNTTFKIQR